MDYMVETNDISKSYGDFTAVDSMLRKILKMLELPLE